jgi:signal transduction protein with GAF and PtsI domain
MGEKLVRKFYLKQFKAISDAISTYDDLHLLVNHLAEGTTLTFEAKGCSIMVLDEREKQLFPLGSYGVSEKYLEKGPLFIDEKWSAFITGKPEIIHDLSNNPLIQYPRHAAEEGIVAMLTVPVVSRISVMGLWRIYFGEPKYVHEEDVDSLMVLGKLLGLAIENSGVRNFVEGVKTAMGSLPLRMLKGL